MRRVARFLLAALVVSALASTGEFIGSHVLAESRSRALWGQAEGGPGTIADFTRLGPTGWDRLYIFHPYTPDTRIHEALGYQWPDAERSGIGSGKGVNLVVFTKAGRVVGWFDHPRNRGDLKAIASADGYPEKRPGSLSPWINGGGWYSPLADSV